jgi:uncharacterized protein (DUF1499 family)
MTLVVSPPSEAEFRALLAKGSSAGVAVTDPRSDDPRLRPRHFPLPPAEVRGRVISAILSLPRWQVEAFTGPVLWAVHTTRLLRFREDIFILVEPADSGSVVLARSASRMGPGDLGQNRRNLAELWVALERSLGPAGVATLRSP